MKHWEEVKKKAIAKFRDDNAYWEKRKREFNSSDMKLTIQASGRQLVRNALGGGNTIVVEVQPQGQEYRIKVYIYMYIYMFS